MTVEQLHSLFLSLGGLALPLSPFHKDHWTESLWFDWSRRFTEQDLRLVMRYKKEMVKTRHWNPSCLSFRNTVGDPYKFGEFLAQARAHYRCKPASGEREQVLRATARPMIEDKPFRHVSEVDWQKGMKELWRSVE